MARRVPPAQKRPLLTLPYVLAGVIAAPLMLAGVAGLARSIDFDALAEAAGLTFSDDATPVNDKAEPAKAALVDNSSSSEPAAVSDRAVAALPTQAPAAGDADAAPAQPEMRVAAATVLAPAVLQPLSHSGDIALALPPLEFVETLPAALQAPMPDMARPTPRATIGGIAESEIAALKLAIGHYRKGNLAAGDDAARALRSETGQLAAEWAAVRLVKQANGFQRLARFAHDNPDLPMNSWATNRAADALFGERVAPERVLAFFQRDEPKTAGGKVALARALQATGKASEAAALVRATYRDDKTNTGVRAAIETQFPGAVTNTDQRYLAYRLVYEGRMTEGAAVAQKAGPQAVQLAQLLTASINESAALNGLLAKLDLPLRAEAVALFARAQNFRRTGRFVEAAQTLLAAPDDADKIVDGDEWWVERRMLVRKLLDSDNAALAYKIAAGHHAETSGHIVDAEVHAGWIALRFNNAPDIAGRHFAKARAAATTPTSLARADYWQGRAAEAMADPHASEFYAAAAQHGHAFFGQLALTKIGQAALPNAGPALDDDALRGAAASRGHRVIRALLDAEARDLAQPMIIDAARIAPNLESLVTLGDLLAQYQLPKLTLQAGKVALMKGMMSEDHAFPTFGIPAYEAAGQSAEKAIVYSIARQESEFDAAVVSHAGARGLMQLMPATAVRTANRRNMRIDVAKLTTDPVLNAQIGAAHLADLFGEYDGSYILSFAAYNAGGKRVREWINAYGDPRLPGIDKIDWIERIPITETRDYVKKIMENVQVYRARLYGQRKLDIEADLVRGAKPPRDAAAAPVRPAAPNLVATQP